MIYLAIKLCKMLFSSSQAISAPGEHLFEARFPIGESLDQRGPLETTSSASISINNPLFLVYYDQSVLSN